eukprot:CAMPEP_0202895994 /NCGR_PEP_ID=MMETSP1392-20130828/5088_1 /ASSEMBLY_ACC=CAM_ASM_000868 /TAXON_ID=225041 /ORGANISM="Chlamydomonas chlamydogama, Strain SAG 11-48b" /LENGTH=38 /DNA_ID= /DNA_START= /DNA_END= /DNA_ORIENTATION=
MAQLHHPVSHQAPVTRLAHTIMAFITLHSHHPVIHQEL